MPLTPIPKLLTQDPEIEPVVQQLQIPGLDIPDSANQLVASDRLELPFPDQNLENLHTPSTPSEDVVQLSLFPEDYEI